MRIPTSTKTADNNDFFLTEERIKNLTSYDNNVNKEKENPLLRVFLMTYNHVKFIRYCLNGILMQRTDFPFEIYIQDDCSTDGTSDIIREYANKYPNITVGIHSENLYTKGQLKEKMIFNMKNHNCKYLAFCEGDDYWIDPYKLQIQVGFLEKHSDFSICSGGWITNNCFNGNQEINIREGFTGIEYDFATAHKILYLILNLTRVWRADATPEFETVKKYKYFRDIHLEYYILTKGKGYFFSRIFGVYNKHQGGVFSRASTLSQITTDYRVYEELYRETRDEQLKGMFIYLVKRYAFECLKTDEQRVDFYKNFKETFPEISQDIECLFKEKGLI